MNLRIKKILFAFTLIITGQIVLNGQNFTIRNYTTKDGLPHDNVRAIARDSTGFIWVATWDGLSRYDGYEFKNYYHEPDDSTSIPFFSVFELLVDKNNNLWIHTDNGRIAKYNRDTDDFSPLRSVSGINIERSFNIGADDSGNLVIIKNSEILILNENLKVREICKLQKADGEPFILEGYPCSATFLNGSELWIASLSVLKFTKSGDGIFTLTRDYPLHRESITGNSDFDFKVWFSMYRSDSGQKWLFSNTGLFRLDEEIGEFREVRSGIPVDEFRGQKDFVWGWMNDGIYVKRKNEKKLTHIPVEKTKMPIAFLPGHNNSFWLSNTTVSGVALGISHVINTTGFFENYLITDPDSASPAVYALTMDKDRNIWAGIRGYDHILRFGNDKMTRTIGKLPEEMVTRTGHIRSLIPVSTGIWIGYFKKLLRFYDYATGRFTDYYPDVNSLRAIAVNKEGNILTGNSDISVFSPETGKTEYLWNEMTGINTYRIVTESDSLVYATLSGNMLLKLNIKERSARVVKLPGTPVNVEDVIVGDDGELWLALLGEGVCRYNISSGKAKFYTTSGGLSNNTTYSLLRDKSGNIWVSTNKGISRINPETDRIRRFGQPDGLEISEFNSGAKFLSDDGEFIFGGMGGFVRFYPDSISELDSEARNARILLTQFNVSGEPKTLSEPLNETDTIILKKGETNFHLSFSTTDFTNSINTIYRYRLSGINENWIISGPNNRNINYTNLSPGWYRLIIEATDSEGNWSLSKSIVVRLTPYFYQRLIFLILAPAVLIMVVVFSVFTYIRQIKQKALQTQDELKLQSLRGQMNPHFIFNSLNSINYFISNNDKISANRYIADFSRLIRSILYNFGNDFIPIDKEVESLTDYLNIEHLRYEDKFDFVLDTMELNDIQSIKVFPGLVQPFVENAIWHGVRPLENRKGQVIVKFRSNDTRRVSCTIEDDGVGRKQSCQCHSNNDRHKSRGIWIATERLKLISKLRGINYELVITDLQPDKPETGTRVIIDIPVM